MLLQPADTHVRVARYAARMVRALLCPVLCSPAPLRCCVPGCLQDWPHKWQSFIPDIVAASKTNETLCENSMTILKLLSEEVFDFSRGELTQVRREAGGANGMAQAVAQDVCLCMFGHSLYG